MQVKNEYVKIKSNGKEYTFKNWIYDEYLKLFSKYQQNLYEMPGIVETNETKLSACFIKLETSLDDYKNAETSDFDIIIPLKNYEISGNEQGTSTVYEYSSLMINYAKPIDLTQYEGKKITAIGFGGIIQYVDVSPIYKIYACLDTSFYSIYVNSQEGIEISRKDTIQSNAICKGYEYPLHLAPVLNRTSEPSDEYKGAVGKIRAILYSVGFGNSIGELAQEWKIGEEAIIQKIDDFSYGVAMKNPTNLPIYPSNTVHPSNSRYPVQPKYRKIIYPQEARFTGNNLYPMQSGYNYIIFKYRLYYNILNNIIYLDEYYTMSYGYNPKGIFIAKNTIERR